MQQARQIGKIVVTYRNGISGVQTPAAHMAPGLTLPADAPDLPKRPLQRRRAGGARGIRSARRARARCCLRRHGPRGVGPSAG
ncbi:hypothetical protein G6F53_014216 [Rhizopus delemar]|nr:hypothetical protein G6F53_014216 [Rhizopus delemar]